MQDWNRRQAITGIAAGTAWLAADTDALAQIARPPNVIFIVADDLGYADLGCTGSRHIRTPHIDALAAGGLLLKQGYSNSPVCSPTRTSLLTGCYQYRFPVGLEEPLSQFSPTELTVPFDRATIADRFKSRGYSTALVGKWHLGDTVAASPLSQGYDHFFGILPGGADYFLHRQIMNSEAVGPGLRSGKTEIERTGYLTDLFGDEAVRLIREKSRPLFLSLHFTAPHWPWEGREDEAVARSLKNFFHGDGGSLQTYANMVQAMDDNIGKVVAALRESGELGNTIIVFTSDNGGERFSDTWPFIGMKGELLEGGIRVPIIFHWPRRIAPGRTHDQIMASMDFLPTLLAAIGDPARDESVDGVNLGRQIFDSQPAIDREIFWRFRKFDQAAVRDGPWKYLSIKGREYLFNLDEDARERADLKDRHPEVLARLKQKWTRWNSAMLPYPEISPETGQSMKAFKNDLADR